MKATDHEKWLIHHAKKCVACDKRATTVIRYTDGCYTVTGSYCDEDATDRRESYGSTRAKREKHAYAECPRDEQHFADALEDLRRRYPEPRKPYVSTVSVVA